MDVFEAVTSRRSVRRFLDNPVSDDLLEQCLIAAQQAPSATNSQPWKWLVIRRPEVRKRVARAAYGQSFIATAPVLMVLLGDMKVYRKRLRRGKELVEIGAILEEDAATLNEAYKNHKTLEGDKRHSIELNCMLSGQNFVLAATALGLGTCWTRLFDEDVLREELKLPDSVFPVALIPVGYAAQNPPQRPRYSLEDVAFNEWLEVPWGCRPDDEGDVGREGHCT